VSRQDKFEPPAIDGGSGEPTADEVRLQIDLRLRLDEVAADEAQHLRDRPREKPSKGELAHLARRMYDARRQRDRMMKRKLFGEPAWDMLLALYSMRGQFFAPKGLTHAADVPVTTGQRWQALLTEEGLIERVPPGCEPRRQWIRLTEKGQSMMDAYLTRLYYCDTPWPISFRREAVSSVNMGT
jgi:DNA-binding MarR family transcriptional regulator